MYQNFINFCESVGCEIGYVGYNCTKPCMYPSYGERCQKACHCTEDLCDHRLGCILPQGMIIIIFVFLQTFVIRGHL